MIGRFRPFRPFSGRLIGGGGAGGGIPAPSYWINALTGDDSNDGTTAGAAWASLSKIADVPLVTGATITVAVASGTYDKLTDYIGVSNNSAVNAHLIIQWGPDGVMDGTAANAISPTNAHEFNGAVAWKTTVLGNNLTVQNYSEGTSASPNGFGNRDTHTLIVRNAITDNCDDGFSCHGDAFMFTYDCASRNSEKGEFLHVDNAYVEHHRHHFELSGVNNGRGAGSPTIKLFDSELIPATSTGVVISIMGTEAKRCQIGTLDSRIQITGVGQISESFVNVYSDGNSSPSLDRCYGKVSYRVRSGGVCQCTNSVISGPATGQSAVILSNFDFGADAKMVFNDNIVTTSTAAAFMSVASYAGPQLVGGESEFYNNFLTGSAAYDADLIAADTGGTVIVGTVTADPLIGPANTLDPDDYGYAPGSPCIGSGTSGGNIGFAIGEVLAPAI